MGSNPTPCTTERTLCISKIFAVIYNLKKQGYSERTLLPMAKWLKMLAKRVDLDNPEAVKDFIAKQNWSVAFKENVVNAYEHYCRFHGIQWSKPKYKRVEKIHRVPSEEDINKIISHASLKYALGYSIIRDTGLRPIELEWLKVKDIDLENGVVYPRTAKHGEGRVLRLKPSTLAMLKKYIQKHNLKPNDNLGFVSRRLTENWIRLRNNVADKLQQPHLKMIRLYDLRHFFGSMTYWKTKDIVYTQRLMGHRNIKNTLRYVHLVNFDKEEFIVKVARTVKEACQLIEQGFEYVTEIDGVKLFRKPEQFLSFHFRPSELH